MMNNMTDNNKLEERYARDSGFEDLLILVDEGDNVTGHQSKAACHEGAGILHRAFSIFIFDSRGHLLLHRRSALKPLWPLYWTNSVCSHPRKGEDYQSAAQRRLKEEIGIDTPLTYLFKFQYQAPFKDIGSENEMCAVFTGQSDDAVTVDPAEIAECRYISPEDLDREILETPEQFTPWFKIEWERIKKT